MARVFVARWAMVDALASAIEDININYSGEVGSREIAERLIEAGWRLADDA